jgi:hypothetical protein
MFNAFSALLSTYALTVVDPRVEPMYHREFAGRLYRNLDSSAKAKAGLPSHSWK